MFLPRIPVVWHLNHSSALPWHKVTSNGSLVLMHVDHSAQGNYSCYDNQGLLLHSVKLMLGRKCCSDLSGPMASKPRVITLSPLFLASRCETALKLKRKMEKVHAVVSWVFQPLRAETPLPRTSRHSLDNLVFWPTQTFTSLLWAPKSASVFFFSSRCSLACYFCGFNMAS